MMNAILTVLIVLPFVLAVLLANVAERNPKVRPFHYLYLLLLNGLLILVGSSSLVLGILQSQGAMPEMGAGLEQVNWSAAGAVLIFGPMLAMVVLLPPIRQVAARLFDINASSILHATALSMTVTALAANVFQMYAASFLLTSQGQQQLQSVGGITVWDILVFPLATLLITGLIGVGWLTRRHWAEIRERLGLKLPTVPQLGLVILVTALLLGLSMLMDRAWSALDPTSYQRVGGVSEEMLKGFTGLAGAFAIGITAALGEETFFRGAYQPRMGILMTAVLFASFHTQYFISLATLLVLVIGLILGVLRQRTSLVVCILVHFLYNFLSVALGT